MNLSEFKAWFEGFTENLDGPPGEKAWKKIQAKVKDIKDAPPTTHTVFRDYYWRPYYGPYWGVAGGAGGAVGLSTTLQGTPYATALAEAKNAIGNDASAHVQWNSSAAFKALGTAEAQALA